MSNYIICLMGPTASGKTATACQLADCLPVDIISVDSAMLYRDMNIGTAKPDATTLQQYPHALIDIINPNQTYSVANFITDVHKLIATSFANRRIPLLVGGTMMYFHGFEYGLTDLPSANDALRRDIEHKAQQYGWQFLHKQLEQVDSISSQTIKPMDKQRITRALEVWHLTGKPISSFKKTKPAHDFKIYNFGLMPNDRQQLHQDINQRFMGMLQAGLVDEVQSLKEHWSLSLDMPAGRSVGYRQVLQYLDEQCSYSEMEQNAMTATRQLAKRQLTWLRSWPDIQMIEYENASAHIIRKLPPEH